MEKPFSLRAKIRRVLRNSRHREREGRCLSGQGVRDACRGRAKKICPANRFLVAGWLEIWCIVFLFFFFGVYCLSRFRIWHLMRRESERDMVVQWYVVNKLHASTKHNAKSYLMDLCSLHIKRTVYSTVSMAYFLLTVFLIIYECCNQSPRRLLWMKCYWVTKQVGL